MGTVRDFLERSQTVRIIEGLEKGKSVDLRQVLDLQALEIARAGELFVVESLERTEQADEQAFGKWPR